jgi:DNA polymerase-3 subunit epsilon
MNVRDYQDGYPDVMVLRGERLSFEEIKAPGDQLRRNQLVTLRGLRDTGFDVSMLPVIWVQDPLQPYVVVDIETTGGRSDSHRITEIGMVKVVAGKVVATWQSLINPERPIPPAITRLTGITNDMVASAPPFATVAEEVAAFTEDAIFVAHNVNFDYGFIRQEFARLEQYYRRPKLCTVQLMRKTHPGLASYSLAALSQHFNIPLESHHRALHDAKAAAGLLSIAKWQQPLEGNGE